MEVGRLGNSFYVAGGLPSARHGDWYVTLKPGESYQAAPMAFGCVEGGFTEAIATLQGFRRKACRPDSDADRHLPVFFNDYMNCLNGNPTEEAEIPMIDAAAAGGADYFVIDAGWFEPKAKTWGSSLGDWRESPDRFPRGLAWLCDYIRSKGMEAGLWAEIECVSPKAKVAGKPDSWFVCANGRRVNVGGLYFFNFANEQVRKYCTDAVVRLARDYGMRYIKLDYNADSGLGDNRTQPSLGAGQTANIRGFYQWLDGIRAAVPELIVENCGSGGQRFEYGLLNHTHVQSTSDQTDYRRYPSIMAGCLAAGLPEQMCCWSYPLEGQDDEAICFNLVTPMLSRWHLSGRIDRVGASGLALVRQATDLWKRRVRANIPKMTPFWPTPFRHLHEQDCWLAAGLRNLAGTKAFVTVFRLNSPLSTVELPVDGLKLAGAEARILFPTHLGGQVKLNRKAGELVVTLPRPYSAKLIEISAGRK
jgi:alpha-galactosidase